MAGLADVIWQLAHDLYPAAALDRSRVLDRVSAALQEHRLIRIRVECLGLDSTSVKVHPDGTGAPKKTDLKPLASPGVDGTPRFIWLPRMSERP